MSDQQPPHDVCLTVKGWLNTKIGANYSECFLKEIYENTTLKKRFKKPPSRFPKTLEGGNVAVISNGRVWGQNGAIITPDNKLVWDVSLEYVMNYKDHSIFKENLLPPVLHHFNTIADLSHTKSHNYYHWMFEVIPRLHLIQKSGVPVNQFIINLESEHLPIQHETLLHLGIEEPNLIKTHRHFHISANQLVVPSQPNFYPTIWGYNYLRSAFLKENIVDFIKKKRIYISRKSNRRIINEEELLNILTKYGFIKIELENMTVAEQVELFASAEVIISPHGAGLTNLAFCNPATKVIEIFSPAYINCIYWLISLFGNLDYQYIIGEYGERDQEFQGQDWQGFDNIRVNLKKLYRLLKNIGI